MPHKCVPKQCFDFDGRYTFDVEAGKSLQYLKTQTGGGVQRVFRKEWTACESTRAFCAGCTCERSGG